MSADIIPARPPAAVRLRLANEGEPLLVTGFSLEDGRLAVQLPLRGMGDWLKENKFSWVTGSNGIWTRSI